MALDNPYQHKSSFFWGSKLSDERKEEIISWTETLLQEEILMLRDIIEDTVQEAQDGMIYDDRP